VKKRSQIISCLYLFAADLPEAPRSVEASEVSRAGVVLQWQAPRSDGGVPIRGYIVERAPAYSNRWMRVTWAPVTDTYFRDVNVHDGCEYEYRVCAENEAGEGAFSKAVGPITARDTFGMQPLRFHVKIVDVYLDTVHKYPLGNPSLGEFDFLYLNMEAK
jgi:Fibronectin type III domain